MNLTGLYSASIRSLVLIAPAQARCSSAFWKASGNYSEYSRLIADMQRLRGRVYVQDGAISPSELTEDGRQVLSTDEESWHLLTVDLDGRVLGCVRYLQHENTVPFQKLRVAEASIASCSSWGQTVRDAVRGEIYTARSLNYSYVEVGGWAMAEEIRCTTEALRTVLAIYAWSHLIGGALGISTATERNGSANILRRLGGRSLQSRGMTIPAYFDPHYKCNMELIGFDSRFPNPRYAETIEELKTTLQQVPVICPEKPLWQTISAPAFAPSRLAVGAAA